MATIPNDEFKRLAENQLFSGMAKNEVEQVVRAARLHRVDTGEFYFMQGDPASGIFIIREGHTKLTQITTDGQQILLRILGPWELFAIVGMVEGRVYPVSAQATEPGQAYFWEREVLFTHFASLPRLAVNAMTLMAGLVQDFQDRLRELATERVERRLARAIIRLASQAGKKTPEGVLIELDISRQDLAEMTGTTLFTVSRILSQWENDGLIISKRKRVIIRFPHGLVRIAEDV